MKIGILSLRHAVLALLMAAALGLVSLQQLPRSEVPFIQSRNATISTVFRGADAARVEALVTRPIERMLLRLEVIDEFNSTSRDGVSIIALKLRDDVELIDVAWAKVRDELARVSVDLPANAGTPELNDRRGYSYTAAISVEWVPEGPADQIMLQRVALAIADRLRALSGSWIVNIHGDAPEYLHVILDERQLPGLGLSATDIASILKKTDQLQATGVISNEVNDITVALHGAIDDLDRLRNVIVKDIGNQSVRLGDIAALRRAVSLPVPERAFVDDRPAVFVGARMREGLKVSDWLKQVRGVVSDFQDYEQDRLAVNLAFEQGHYTDERISLVSSSLLFGLVFVVGILFLTVGVRASLSVSFALVVTVVVTLGLLPVMGVGLNEMSAIGILVALGLVVDNAIIVTNEIRHFMMAGLAAAAAADKAVRKLMLPILASTATTIMAFMPVVLMPGMAGEFVGPMSKTVIVSLVSSFFVSMFILPSLAPTIFATAFSKKSRWWEVGVGAGPARAFMHRLLYFLVSRPKLGVVLSGGLAVSGLVVINMLPTVFFPTVDRDQFRIMVSLPPNASIENTADVVKAMAQDIRLEPGVTQTFTFVGSAALKLYYNAMAIETNNPAYAEILVNTRASHDAETAIKRLNQVLPRSYPEAQVIARPYTFGPAVVTPIELRIYGPELEELERLGEQVALLLTQEPGTHNVRQSLGRNVFKLNLDINEDSARRSGLSPNDIARDLNSALSGRWERYMMEGSERMPVTVQYREEGRDDQESLESMWFVSQSDPSKVVPLRAFANVTPTASWNKISHFNGERVQLVSAFVQEGRLPSQVLASALKRIERDSILMPPGYRLSVAGEEREGSKQLSALLSQVTILVFLSVGILVLLFNSFRRMVVVFASALSALGIGFLALAITGNAFGFLVMVGIMGLIGVGINDTIVILTALDTDEQTSNGGPKAIADIVTGSTARHVISTTVTTLGGFIPLLLSGGSFWPPFAEVFMVGLSVLTALAFVFTPCAFVLIKQADKKRGK